MKPSRSGCRRLALGIVASLALATAHSETPTDDAPKVFARVSPSVVTIRTLNPDGADDGLGSGVVIASAQVVTNCHVVQDAASIRVTAAGREFPAQWVRRDPQRDICLLSVEGLSAPAVALRPSPSLVTGEAVFAVGNPLGLGLSVSRGLLAAKVQRDGQPILVTTAAVSPGSSGGGLFDRDGKLVGITTAILGTGQNLNLILSADGLERLASDGKPPQHWPAPAAEHHWNEEAVALQQSGDWPKLEAHARAWLAVHPQAADALTFLGLALNLQHRLPEAADAHQRAVEMNDHNGFGWLQYAATLHQLGRRSEADKAMARAIDLQPSEGQPRMLRADWLRVDGRHDEAYRDITEAVRLSPGLSAAWRILGLVEEARGNADAARRAFQIALRLGEQDTELRQQLARNLATSGKPDEASRVAAGVAESSRSDARTHLAIGLGELQRGRLGPAEAALRKALAIDPGSADGWSGLGGVLGRSKRFKEAAAAFDRALELAPDNVEVLTNRAIVRRELGHHREGLDDARRATELAPSYAQAWSAYGVALGDQRKFREAVAALVKVDELGNANIADLVNLGIFRTEAGDIDGALKTLARAEAINPRHPGMCVTTAKALSRKGDLPQALTYLERALKEDPTNLNAWSSKGYTLMKLGRLPEAVDALETTVRLGPDFANGWINLGEAQLRSKNLGRAIPVLEKAVVLAPTAVDARLYLSQAYLAARLPARAREHAQLLLTHPQGQEAGLGILLMSYLIENDAAAASTAYLKLKAVSPALARNLRNQGIAGRMPAAMGLPE